jgi:hypothetical protein
LGSGGDALTPKASSFPARVSMMFFFS